MNYGNICQFFFKFYIYYLLCTYIVQVISFEYIVDIVLYTIIIFSFKILYFYL